MEVAWDITSKCNLSCVHCYNSRLYSGAGTDAAGRDLSTEQVRVILKQMRALHVEAIQFLGGEPLVRSDFVDILRSATDEGIECNVATNGIPLDESRIEAIAELDIRQIAFSIDGSREKSNDYLRGEGAFRKAIGNLALTVECFARRGTNTQVGIQCTLSKLNLNEVSSVVSLGKRLGVDFVGFDSLKIIASEAQNDQILSALTLSSKETVEITSEIAAIIADETEIEISVLNFASPKLRQHVNDLYGSDLRVHRRCDAASEMMYIRADGSVFPCNYCSDFPAGFLPKSVRSQVLDAAAIPLADIVDSKGFKEFYRFAHSGKTYECLNYCRQCRLYDVCEPCPLDVARWGERVCRECIEFDRVTCAPGAEESVRGPGEESKA